MAEKRLKIWYDKEGDFLEVTFEQRPGVFRETAKRHEYRWVLREFVFESGCLMRVPIDRGSPEGRRAIARFHSDAEATMKGGVPHWFRRIFKRRQHNGNARELLRWLADPGYDPVMNVRHRSSAKWAWW